MLFLSLNMERLCNALIGLIYLLQIKGNTNSIPIPNVLNRYFLLPSAVNRYLRFQGSTKRNYDSSTIISIYPLLNFCKPAKLNFKKNLICFIQIPDVSFQRLLLGAQSPKPTEDYGRFSATISCVQRIFTCVIVKKLAKDRL